MAMFGALAKTPLTQLGFILTLAAYVAACGLGDLPWGPPGSSTLLQSGLGICLGNATDGQRLIDITSIAQDINDEKIQNIPHGAPITTSSTYEIKLSPGKGLGIFAIRALKKGTRIVVEEPLVTVPAPEMIPGQGFRISDMVTSLEDAYDRLSSKQQEEFLSLHDFRFPSEQDQSHLLTIFRSNAYNTGDSSIGLFPITARINHSCRPNSGNWWSKKAGGRIIYAARDIEEGEEITVSYIPLLKAAKDRQARLGQYGFTCGCEACQLPENDNRRIKIGDLLASLEQKLQSPDEKVSTYARWASKAVHLVDMIEAEGLTDYLARAVHAAAVFSQRSDHEEAALKWAKKELEIHQLAEDDSEEALLAMTLIESLENE